MMADSVGTAGVSKALKQHDPSIRVVLVDPPGSSLYNKVRPLPPIALIVCLGLIYGIYIRHLCRNLRESDRVVTITAS